MRQPHRVFVGSERLEDRRLLSALPVVGLAVKDGTGYADVADSATTVVSRTGSTASALKVHYTTAGSAINNVDFRKLAGWVTIPAGSASAVVVVHPFVSATPFSSKTVIVKLGAEPYYAVNSAHASSSLTIFDYKPGSSAVPDLLFQAASPAALTASPVAGIFLNLAGIAGSSTDATFKNQLNVADFSYSITTPVVAIGTGKAVFGDFVIDAVPDASAPLLFSYAASGKHIASALLSVTKADGSVNKQYLQYTLSDVVVTSLKTTVSVGSGAVEQFSLSYSKITVTYTPYDSTGKQLAKITAGWDVKANKAL